MMLLDLWTTCLTCDGLLEDQLPSRFEHSGQLCESLRSVDGGAVHQEAGEHPVEGGGCVRGCVRGGQERRCLTLWSSSELQEGGGHLGSLMMQL